MEVNVDQETDSVLFPNEKYYWRNFLTIISEIQTNENIRDLFNDEENTVFRAFNDLSPEAQMLYIRLFNRKYSWHRISSLNYAEISLDLNGLISDLIEKQFLMKDVIEEEVSLLMSLMTLPELKTLCKSFRLKCDGKKENLSKSLIDFSRNQKSIFGGFSKDIKTVIREKVIVTLGRIIKLTSKPRKLFLRAMILYSLPLARDMEMDGKTPLQAIMSRANAKQIIYPDYPLKPLEKLFTSREALIKFQDALELLATVRGKVASKSLDEVDNLYDAAIANFKEVLENQTIREYDEKLPNYLRSYATGAILARAVFSCIDCLRMKKLYAKMVIAYQVLLKQELYLLHYRGRWYDQLALIYHHHLKDVPAALYGGSYPSRKIRINFVNSTEYFYEHDPGFDTLCHLQAVELLVQGMSDRFITVVDKALLSSRGLLIVNSKKKGKLDAEKHAILASLLIQAMDPPEITIEARCVQSKIGVGSKLGWVHEGEEGTGQILSSVEEAVILHHRKIGYEQGIHAENAISMTIFGIFFWDIIYTTYIANVFISPYQTHPLDLKSGDFYNNREELIQQRVKEMEEEWDTEKMNSYIRRIASEEKGKECIVSWTFLEDLKQFEILMECIGLNVISKICTRIAKEFPIARKGFPDIVIWSQNTKKCKFIEVKGPGDRLSPSQRSWLEFLNASGAEAAVCHVKATGAKSLKRKAASAENADNIDTDVVVLD